MKDIFENMSGFAVVVEKAADWAKLLRKKTRLVDERKRLEIMVLMVMMMVFVNNI